MKALRSTLLVCVAASLFSLTSCELVMASPSVCTQNGSAIDNTNLTTDMTSAKSVLVTDQSNAVTNANMNTGGCYVIKELMVVNDVFCFAAFSGDLTSCLPTEPAMPLAGEQVVNLTILPDNSDATLFELHVLGSTEWIHNSDLGTTYDLNLMNTATVTIAMTDNNAVLSDATILPTSPNIYQGVMAANSNSTEQAALSSTEQVDAYNSIGTPFAAPEVAVTTNLDLGSSLIINRDACDHLNGAAFDVGI